MYNKLFSKIVDSSIWLESTPTRLLWMMFIAVMDEDGFCQFACIDNVASRARLGLDETREAILTLESPDSRDPSQEYEGRRIERVPGGWMVLNSKKYRDIVTREIARERNRIRVANCRSEKKKRAVMECNGGVMACNASVTQSEAVSAAEAEHPTTVPARTESEPGPKVVWDPVKGFAGVTDAMRDEWRVAFPACDLTIQFAQMNQWLKANPLKARKSNWQAFIVNWLRKSQDRGGDVRPAERLSGREAQFAREAEHHTKPNPRAGI